MLLRTITDIEEIKYLLDIISNESHRNAENYCFEKMKKRWDKYHQFHLLEDSGTPVAIGGIYKFGDLVRICDRYCTLKHYRRFDLHKQTNYIRPAVEYFVTNQTDWALENGYQPFISLSSEVYKVNAMNRFISMIDPKYSYRLLPDLYLTGKRSDIKCHQHIITNQDNINLEAV